MADPSAYDVLYAINPHMSANLGGVDRARACDQWAALRQTFLSIGVEVSVVPTCAGLPDLVFAANSATALGPGTAMRSRMANPEREGEVDHVATWLTGRNWRVLPAPDEPLEGQGDLRRIPGERRWLGGHGFRSTLGALAQFARAAGTEVVSLRLVDDRLYHLDTALMPLRPGLAAWVPAAFDAAARATIAAIFPERIEIPLDEAIGSLAANGIVFGRAVVIEAAASHTRRSLTERGFDVVGVDTSEFLKSGGSVFCLTQQVPRA